MKKKFPVVPLENPPFTLDDIRRSIPERLFKRNTVWSLLFVFRGFGLACVLWYFATFIDLWFSGIFNLAAWCVFGLFQGCVLYGPWIIGNWFASLRCVSHCVNAYLYS